MKIWLGVKGEEAIEVPATLIPVGLSSVTSKIGSSKGYIIHPRPSLAEIGFILTHIDQHKTRRRVQPRLGMRG